MIDPKDFISGKKKEEESGKFMPVSGTFMCQECELKCTDAKLDELKGVLVYFCPDGHRSEAKL